MEEDELLVEEHKELIQLYIHEDRLAWYLIQFNIVLNVGLLSLLGVLSETLRSLFPLGAIIGILLCFFGGSFGLIGYFMLQRSEIHRTSRKYKALMIEDELAKRKVPFDTLKSCEYRIFHQKEILEDHKGNVRKLTWSETVETLNIFKRFVMIIGFGWFVTGIIWLATFFSQILN